MNDSGFIIIRRVFGYQEFVLASASEARYALLWHDHVNVILRIIDIVRKDEHAFVRIEIEIQNFFESQPHQLTAIEAALIALVEALNDWPAIRPAFAFADPANDARQFVSRASLNSHN